YSEIDRVITRHFDKRVVNKRQHLRRNAADTGGDRRCGCGRGRDGERPVNDRPEGLPRRILCGARLQRLRKTYSERRDSDGLDRIYAVVKQGVSPAQHRLSVAKDPAQESFPERGVPGRRETRRYVRPIGIEGVIPPRLFDRYIRYGRVVDLPLLGRRELLL